MHTCLNCGLPIQEHEEEVRVDGAQLEVIKRRLNRAGLRRRDVQHSTLRYRHATYDICTEAEAGQSRWLPWEN